MPRKPSSLFLIAEQPGGQLNTTRVSLANDADPEAIINQHFQMNQGVVRVYAVEDTKVDAYEAGLKISHVEDPRLSE